MKMEFVFITYITGLFLMGCSAGKISSKESTFGNKKVSNAELSDYQQTKLYIETYKQLAIEQMHNHKIPASITLAQGILESGKGQSNLVKRSNNHFGIKCHKDWKGGRVYHNDDKLQECFRKYKDPVESFKDHSLFLVNRRRYAYLFDLDITDYKSWSKELSRAGYATNPKYSSKLIQIIELHKLHIYDKSSIEDFSKEEIIKVQENNNSGLHRRLKPSKNGRKHVVSKGDTLYSVSRLYGMSVEQVKNTNNLSSSELSIGQVLYVK